MSLKCFLRCISSLKSCYKCAFLHTGRQRVNAVQRVPSLRCHLNCVSTLVAEIKQFSCSASSGSFPLSIFFIFYLMESAKGLLLNISIRCWVEQVKKKLAHGKQCEDEVEELLQTLQTLGHT